MMLFFISDSQWFQAYICRIYLLSLIYYKIMSKKGGKKKGGDDGEREEEEKVMVLEHKCRAL